MLKLITLVAMMATFMYLLGSFVLAAPQPY